MKIVLCALFISFACIFLVKPVYAQVAPTPSINQDQDSASQSANSTQESSNFVTFLVGLLKDFDKTAGGGLVFTTPDVLAGDITLPGGGSFPGFQTFRDVFQLIGISVVAIILAVMGANIFLDDGQFQLKPLVTRLLLTGGMFIALPIIMSLTIQATNLLNNQILTLGAQTPTSINYSQLPVQILQDIGNAIITNQSPASIFFPNVQISLFNNFIQSAALFLFESFVLLFTLLFFLIAFVFILFQFIIRFVSLLFLSILYPLVIPFMLSAKTQGVVKAYLMAWVSFLIHQPAFILGFMIVFRIFTSLLSNQGATLGMLVLYAGALFFLGGVNVLITRIFGEPWTAIGTNVQAAVVAAGIGETAGKFKQGFLGGSVNGLSSLAGRKASQSMGFLPQGRGGFSLTRKYKTKDQSNNNNSDMSGSNPQPSGSSPAGQQNNRGGKGKQVSMPTLTQELNNRGIGVAVVNKKSGKVNIPKTTGWTYMDQRSGLKTTYFSKDDALKDGRKENQLKQSTISGTYSDYSLFSGKGNPNPYNSYATRMKNKNGFKGESHATFTSDEKWMNDHLTLAKDKLDKDGVQGVIGKRWGNNDGKTKDRIIRIYSK